MRGESETKVVGGKLVRLKADFDASVRRVEISGDFFIHPEDAIEKLERSLVGVHRSATKEHILHRLSEASKEVTMIGITYDAIADLLVEALR